MDVKSLYTNIPNSEEIAAVKNAYDNNPKKSITTKVITTFMALILTLNNFIFNFKHYLQIKGFAMGTICAPDYANIFMARFESKLIYPHIKEKVITFLRFIDDLFMIWTDTEEELLKFTNELNQKHKTIKFNFKYSKTKIEFLDVLVYKDSNNKLQTTLYKKPTDRQSYLHANSEHPRSLKESIPYSQVLRVKRICFTNSEFEAHINTIKDQFVKRGYEKTLIKNQMEKVAKLDRSVLLAEQNKSKKASCLPLTVTYNRALPSIKSILQQHWHLLKIDSTLEETFQQTPILAFGGSRNLKDIIGGSKIEFNTVKRKSLTVAKGKCMPCLSNSRTLLQTNNLEDHVSK